MRLHIFNPEHEICLALDKARFTPSHNVMKMRRELAFLPYLWADEDDYVLVDDFEYAHKAVERLSHLVRKNVRFVGIKRLKSLVSERVRSGEFDLQACPWGWDKAVKQLLVSLGWPEERLPSDKFLEDLRQLSHRRTAKRFLENTDFAVYEVTTIPEMLALIEKHGNTVLKSPWSCSGRGIRFVSKEHCTPSLIRWADNIISQQGSLMVEPYYEKIRDFALEFMAIYGKVEFCGLSLFDTFYTAYCASLVTSERNKRAILERHLPADVIDNAICQCRDFIQNEIDQLGNSPMGGVEGVGVDMMIVKSSDGCRLHPCVEFNFRRTMGHVALSIPSSILDPDRRMVIEFARNFELKIK